MDNAFFLVLIFALLADTSLLRCLPSDHSNISVFWSNIVNSKVSCKHTLKPATIQIPLLTLFPALSGQQVKFFQYVDYMDAQGTVGDGSSAISFYKRHHQFFVFQCTYLIPGSKILYVGCGLKQVRDGNIILANGYLPQHSETSITHLRNFFHFCRN